MAVRRHAALACLLALPALCMCSELGSSQRGAWVQQSGTTPAPDTPAPPPPTPAPDTPAPPPPTPAPDTPAPPPPTPAPDTPAPPPPTPAPVTPAPPPPTPAPDTPAPPPPTPAPDTPAPPPPTLAPVTTAPATVPSTGAPPLGGGSPTPEPTPAPPDDDSGNTTILIIVGAACGVVLIAGCVVVYCCTKPAQPPPASLGFAKTLDNAPADPVGAPPGAPNGPMGASPLGAPGSGSNGATQQGGAAKLAPPMPPRVLKLEKLPKEAVPMEFEVTEVEGAVVGRSRMYPEAREMLRTSRKHYIDKERREQLEAAKQELRGMLDVEELIQGSMTDLRASATGSPPLSGGAGGVSARPSISATSSIRSLGSPQGPSLIPGNAVQPPRRVRRASSPKPSGVGSLAPRPPARASPPSSGD